MRTPSARQGALVSGQCYALIADVARGWDATMRPGDSNSRRGALKFVPTHHGGHQTRGGGQNWGLPRPDAHDLGPGGSALGKVQQPMRDTGRDLTDRIFMRQWVDVCNPVLLSVGGRASRPEQAVLWIFLPGSAPLQLSIPADA
jgi:hypothetical protein